MNLSKHEILQQLFILYMETAPYDQEKQDTYDEIMKRVEKITPDDIFIIEFKTKLLQYYSFAEKDGFYNGFDILKRLMK